MSEENVCTEKPFKGILSELEQKILQAAKDLSTNQQAISFTDAMHVVVDAQNGTDADIARIARHDQEGGTEKLIQALMKNRHGSPFEFGYICFKCELPLFVIQQMLRHRIGVSYSQWSLRWDEAPPHFYLPPLRRPLFPLDKKQSNIRRNLYATNTQEEYERCSAMMACVFNYCDHMYRKLLSLGVAQELARIVLPASQMSIIHVSFNPRSLMHFLSLRIDSPENRYPSHPQYEVQQVAKMFSDAFQHYWPITYEAFTQNGRVAP